MNARRTIVVALLLSGAVAGLVGLPELLGRDHAYTLSSPQGYGFTGIAIALLGRNHPSASRWARCCGRSWTSPRWRSTSSASRGRSC